MFPHLPSLFRSILFTVSLSSVLSACSEGESSAWVGFTELSCEEPVKGLAAQLGVASIELFEGKDTSLTSGGDPGGISDWVSLGLDGGICGQAADQNTCAAVVEEKKKTTTLSRLNSRHFHWSTTREAVVLTQGEQAQVITTEEALQSLLDPIDTEEKLKLWLRYQFSLGAPCNFEIRKVNRGFEVWALRAPVGDCPLTHEDRLFLVSPDGVLKLLAQKNTTSSGVCAGRRPEGLAPAVFRDPDALGRFFAQMNHLEAASIDAFCSLEEELAALAAPAALLEGCRSAAEDERRHTAAMGALAARFGGALRAPQVAPRRPRTVEELAAENAAEGCVRETYGALVAAHQAAQARDAEVRAAMAEIARDEANHAALSWTMQAWFEGQLSGAQRARLGEVRRQAIEGLRRELDAEVEAPLQEVAGLPDRATALALLGELESRLWAPGAAS